MVELRDGCEVSSVAYCDEFVRVDWFCCIYAVSEFPLWVGLPGWFFLLLGW